MTYHVHVFDKVSKNQTEIEIRLKDLPLPVENLGMRWSWLAFGAQCKLFQTTPIYMYMYVGPMEIN